MRIIRLTPYIFSSIILHLFLFFSVSGKKMTHIYNQSIEFQVTYVKKKNKRIIKKKDKIKKERGINIAHNINKKKRIWHSKPENRFYRHKQILKDMNKQQTDIKKTKETKKIFGLTFDSVLEGQGEFSVAVGNTLSMRPPKVQSRYKKNQDLEISQTPVVYHDKGNLTLPVVIKEVKPEYPKELKQKGVEGWVILRIRIDKHGKVVAVTPVSYSDKGFVPQAVSAIRKFKFRPAMIDNKPISYSIRYTIRFVLE